MLMQGNNDNDHDVHDDCDDNDYNDCDDDGKDDNVTKWASPARPRGDAAH